MGKAAAGQSQRIEGGGQRRQSVQSLVRMTLEKINISKKTAQAGIIRSNLPQLTKRLHNAGELPLPDQKMNFLHHMADEWGGKLAGSRDFQSVQRRNSLLSLVLLQQDHCEHKLKCDIAGLVRKQGAHLGLEPLWRITLQPLGQCFSHKEIGDAGQPVLCRCKQPVGLRSLSAALERFSKTMGSPPMIRLEIESLPEMPDRCRMLAVAQNGHAHFVMIVGKGRSADGSTPCLDLLCAHNGLLHTILHLCPAACTPR